ncbi:endonuclease/exonuclease/phosphatase family protein [Rhodobacter sp. 24-YEA-8]|uniref:endonuclease/exonuclease/phosphatase family protein n=1 Tax=Rhodobacter sp. 24-YEA-8 TaxID=1884310 RepID=UPI00089B8175|nr:endonuclease/exonuclease/phosphatase family protein [Rhodobacter sp. 24-YEA-8]SEC15979.1 Metal-dependent hydrolase, endonuclease/exonuclease/phosphatase family [Rhodobacter sp. 24-YEA-8]
MTDTSLRIASYNIRKALGTDRRRDPARVLRVIAALGADVVALQEADLRLGQRRPIFDEAEVFRRTGLLPVRFDHGRDSLGWHGNALLVSPGFRVISQSHHDLPGLEPRGLVSALLERDGRRLRVTGVHLGLLRHSRRRQLSALLDMLPEEEDTAMLIAGDFNERSLEVGLGRLSKRFRILSGGPTYHSRHPVFALDRIAISEGFTMAEASVHRSPEASRASDHLPLVADLRLSHMADDGADISQLL